MPVLKAKKYFIGLIGGISLVPLLIPIDASAAVVTFSDGTFDPAVWSLTTQQIQNLQPVNSAGTVSANQGTNGNPGFDRVVNISVNSGSDNEVYGFSIDSATVYSPSIQGAIASLTYQEDCYTTSAAGQQFGPAVEQDGIFYYDAVTHGPFSGWETISRPSQTSSGFVTNSSSTAAPNFTASGDPITFGFVSINNTGINGFYFNSTADYDNWSITVNPAAVPEPMPASVVGIAAILLLLSRRTGIKTA